MLSMEPRVSVVMIFLNAAPYIEEAIESVLAQSYTNWELLLVDDGSTDGSTQIAARYAQQYPRKMRYLEHEGHQNRGMSASRNLGIRNACGEYIAFLDADDVYLPLKLERQVAALAAQPTAAMVYGATVHWYSWSGKPEDLHRDKPRKLGVPPNTLVEPPTLIPLFLSVKAQTPGTCGILVRRAAIDQIGGFEERFRGMFEDQVFLYKLCLKAPVFVESGSWDRYRQHPASHSRIMRIRKLYNAAGKPNPTYHAFLLWLEQYLGEHGVKEASVWQALTHELRPYRHPLIYRVQTLLDQDGGIRRVARRGFGITRRAASVLQGVLARDRRLPRGVFSRALDREP